MQFYKDPRFELYDAVQFFVKEKDKNYEIYSIYGIIYFRNNIENCYPKKSEIVDEISNVFLKSKKKIIHLNIGKISLAKVNPQLQNFIYRMVL